MNTRLIARQRGFTLVELMISLVLGLMVVAAAGTLFISNKRVYAASESVGRIQENQRSSFELIARDIREAGGTPCGASGSQVNMLKNRDDSIWGRFGGGLQGSDNTGPGGTDKLDLFMTNEGDVSITSHTNPSAVLDVSTNAGITNGDILVACNVDVTIIFSVTQTPAGNFIQHNGGGSDANCGQEFQHTNPDLSRCAGASALAGYCFVIPPGGRPGPGCSRTGKGPAVVVRLSALRWEVRDNGRNGQSLYRSIYYFTKDGMNATPASTAEIAEGVRDFQLKYRTKTSTAFVDAGSITNWKDVVAVQMRVDMEAAAGAQQGRERQGTTAGQNLMRSFTNVVALRNREDML